MVPPKQPEDGGAEGDDGSSDASDECTAEGESASIPLESGPGVDPGLSGLVVVPDESAAEEEAIPLAQAIDECMEWHQLYPDAGCTPAVLHLRALDPDAATRAATAMEKRALPQQQQEDDDCLLRYSLEVCVASATHCGCCECLPRSAPPFSATRWTPWFPAERLGFPRWFPSMVSLDGFPRWFPSMVSLDGFPRWFPSMDSLDGFPRRIPSMLTARVIAWPGELECLGAALVCSHAVRPGGRSR